MGKEVIRPSISFNLDLPFSPAIRANGFIFCSGQLPMDMDTGEIVKGDIKQQTKQALNNLKRVLEAAGSSMEKVVKVTVFMKDLSQFNAMNEAYQEFFPQAPPARSTVEVSRLARDAGIEIELIALA